MQVFVALTFHRVKYNGRVPVALWVLEPSQRLTAAEGQSFDRQEQVSLTVQNTVNSNPSRLFNCHFLSRAEGQNFDKWLWRCDGSEGWSICHVYQALRAQLGENNNNNNNTSILLVRDATVSAAGHCLFEL